MVRSFLSARRTRPPVLYPLVCTTAAVFAFVVVMAVFLWLSDKTLEWVLSFQDLDPTHGSFGAVALGEGLIAGFPLGRYYPELRDSLLVCATELNRAEDIDRLAAALGGKR